MDTYFYRFIFMRFLFLLSILMFLVLLTAASLSSLQQPLCHDDERSALLQFKDGFILDHKDASLDPSAYPKVASWSLEGGTNTNCCSWDGVDCNEDTGHVVGLDLASSCLYGSFNSSNSLFRLLQLQRLNLADNHFNFSQIPFGVGNLLRLTYLNLSDTVLSGKIPSELSHLDKLSSLDLSRNYYGLNSTLSDLSSLVQNFTTLEELLLQENNFSSPIPESLANLSSLTTLNLENCELRGEFPTRIFQLPNLRDLRIGGNWNLTVHLPEFHQGSPLKVLSIGETSFFASVRSIPPSLSNLTQLTHLDLSTNTLTGHIPPSVFANLTHLTHLDLSGNTLTGHIPSSVFANLTQLTHLDMSDNTLTGHIPSSLLANLTQLTFLDLSYNKLNGTLEFDMFLKIKSLTYLGLLYNNLTLLTKPNSNDTLPQFYTLRLGSCNLQKFPDFLRSQNKLSVLDLGGNNLDGLVPRWMYNASRESLQTIILSDNFLIGFEQSPIVLPRSNLTSLSLNNNRLQGSLPIPPPSIQFYAVRRNLIKEMSPLICNLSSLYYLDLSYNKLSGMLPPCLGNLSSLDTLQLRSNNLINGAFPSWLVCNLSSLYALDLSYNKLSGMLPPCLGNFSSSLSVLQLQSNNFHGTIPKTWSMGSNLYAIDLSENQLQGQLSSSMANFLMLEYLNVSYNQINGAFPSWLVCNLSSLRALDLSYNNLSGMLHPCLGNFSSPLSVLQLQSNSFCGPIPKTWAMGSNLTVIDLSENQFQGQLPRSMANCMMLRYLNVSYNQINGAFPSWLVCNLSSLEILDLSYNNLSGMLHPCLGNFNSPLSVLQLRSNSFRGPFPKTWAMGNNLKMIDLSENQFQGPLPRSMANFLMLEYLHVGNNQINDTFPFWLGALSQLKVLVLRSNAFQGAIKSSEINNAFPKLHIIDLSQNNFSGNLPIEYFRQWKAMKVVDANDSKYMEVNSTGGRYRSSIQCAITITNKGIILNYKKIPGVFRVIDFSNNRFDGEIPFVLGSLKGLHLLNLSNNALTGNIPLSLGYLTQVESMDLSQNKLSGPIPLQLAELNFLSSFNVSNNCLTGPIPHGGQFDTFENGSFGGNPGLCGSPLSKKCGDFNYTPTPPYPFQENQRSESPFEYGWKVVAIGYGCGFVIGVVIGHIVITRKYGWFVKFFGRM